jgi:type IV secretory pathway VirB10-like protein
MENEKKTSFTVTDRRKFTVEGEPRPDGSPEEQSQPEPELRQPSAPASQAAATTADAPAVQQPPAQTEPTPPPPSAQEQQDQANRYRQSSHEIDSHLQQELDAQGQGRKASDFEITFEKFIASLYMSALLQLGLVHEQSEQPTADLIGARQTIDTISLLAEKTRGNLTPHEEHILSNILYELRMAYVEVTNALVRPPAGVPPDPMAGHK